ncbi:MAG: alpha-glucosidase [Actinobacteria bacterium]|nr:MAG: alpha-glucosidase [Actinomycetota bacterium]
MAAHMRWAHRPVISFMATAGGEEALRGLTVTGRGNAWWKKGVIYQISVASFSDSDADGLGDLRGIINNLDYINDGTPHSLGADAIWLTPINASPMLDFGYDVSDYLSINPRFGNMEVFEELLDACHGRGIKVIMDMVLNHTSSEHPWFVESRSSRDNPKRDWYVWRDGRSPGRPPNRWVAVVEGSAWQYDDDTRQFFYHAFLPFQPDLNWRNPEVRAAMFDVIRFWLDKGVDGFRLDLINFLYEDVLLRENPRRFGMRPYDWQEHLYDRSQPESLEAAKELRRITDEYPGRMMMGEVYTDTPEDAVAYLGDGTDALHLSFYLDFAQRKWNAGDFRESVEWLEGHLPPAGWPCYYLNNHDLPRTYTRLGRGGDAEARAKVAAAMTLTLRGTPIIYYGEEIGMPMSRIPRKMMDDPIGKKFWPIPVGRDGSRTPMQWSGEKNAGFSQGEPWLPVDSSYVERNMALQDRDPASLLNWYRRLIWTRGKKPALQCGNYRALGGTPKGVYAYVRERGEERIAVMLNFVSRERSLAVPRDERGGSTWRILLSTHGEEGAEIDASLITLQPLQALVLEGI